MGGQIENLNSAVDVGAVVNGPNGSSNFSGGLGSLQSGMVKCENDSFTTFTGKGSEYVDDVRSWQSSEPALDMTGSLVLASSLQDALAGSSSTGNDFSLSLSSSSGSVTAGNSATATVSTAVSSGSAESVALTSSGAPSGVAVSFSPSSVTSGGSSTMTVSTTSAVAAGTYSITVTGTASSGSHSATYTLTVGSSGSTCTAAQLLGDPGFENGSTITPWTETSTLGYTPITNDSGEAAHSGTWKAWFNGNGSKDTDTLSQTATIPSACSIATLSFWLHVDTTESTSTAKPDTFTVQLLNSSGSVLTTLGTFSNLNAASGYTQQSYDVSSYIGQAVTLKFTGSETDTSGGTTSFVIDDTALHVS
jgi:hypothetical protein